MYRATVVQLPDYVRSDDDVKSWLEENAESWAEALDLDVDYIDGRANYVNHEFEQIVVTDGEVYVDYTVEYFLYFGCRDLDGGDEEHRDVSGKVVGRTIVFTTFVQPDPHVPADEY